MQVEGYISDFTGYISGYIEEGSDEHGDLWGDVDRLAVIGFSGTVEDANIDPQPRATFADAVVRDLPNRPSDDDEYDDYDDEEYGDYQGNTRIPLQFGDETITVKVDATYPSSQYVQDLSREIQTELEATGALEAEPSEFEQRVRTALRNDAVSIDDERVFPALIALFRGLTNEGVTIHNVEVRNAQGEAVDAPGIIKYLTGE